MVKPVTENKAIWDNIELKPSLAEELEVIYEAEWKRSVLSRNLTKNPTGPRAKRIRNIKDRLEKSVYPVIRAVAENISEVFKDWLRQHSFDPEVWAEARMDSERHLIDDILRSDDLDSFIEFIQGFGGARRGRRGSAGVVDIESGILDYYNENGLTTEAKEFFIQSIDRIEEEERRLDLRQKLKEGDIRELFDMFMLPFIETTESIEQFESVTGVRIDEFGKFLLKNQIFQDWKRSWGSDVRTVKKQIEERTEKLDSIKPSDFGEAFKRINLALNTAHVNGSMVEYIQRRYPDVTLDLLDELSAGPRQEWIEDIRKANLEVPDGMLEKCKKFLKGEITTESFIQVLESSDSGKYWILPDGSIKKLNDFQIHREYFDQNKEEFDTDDYMEVYQVGAIRVNMGVNVNASLNLDEVSRSAFSSLQDLVEQSRDKTTVIVDWVGLDNATKFEGAFPPEQFVKFRNSKAVKNRLKHGGGSNTTDLR